MQRIADFLKLLRSNTLAIYFVFAFTTVILTGCTGARTFHEYARAGDTVALAAGWKHHFRRDNLTVTITSAGGAAVVYQPNDPAVRAVVNLYPDPVSSIRISPQTGQDITLGSSGFADMVNNLYTDNDNDWWETTVYIDLPTTLTVGPATIDIATPEGESVSSTVQVVAGIGSPNTFATQLSGSLTNDQLSSLERVGHYTIHFSGSTIPYAIQADLGYVPTPLPRGQIGVPHLLNPRGDIKNLSWTDSGTQLRVVITPAKTGTLTNWKDLKFYVAGQVSSISLVQVLGVDANGNPVPGVSATID